MNAEDASEVDLFLHELARSVVVEMENYVEWWTSVALVVTHESCSEGSVIRYRSLGDEDRELATTDWMKELVSKCRARFAEVGSGGIQRWELSIHHLTGKYRLEIFQDCNAPESDGVE